jgi:hypothetical protein
MLIVWFLKVAAAKYNAEVRNESFSFIVGVIIPCFDSIQPRQ